MPKATGWRKQIKVNSQITRQEGEKILVLGGTADGRHLCQKLYQANVHNKAQTHTQLFYSVAGVVPANKARQPQVPVTLISGGFSQYGGLQAFLLANAITQVVNATHPYAQVMSDTAYKVCQQLGVPYGRFLRPEWQQQGQDRWHLYSHRQALIGALKGYQTVLLSLGQVSQPEISLLTGVKQVYLRTAVEPKLALPKQVKWIKAIGPFDEQAEHKLLVHLGIEAIASKNSGGAATYGKIAAARRLGLPVYMLQRPDAKLINKPKVTFNQMDALVDFMSAKHDSYAEISNCKQTSH